MFVKSSKKLTFPGTLVESPSVKIASRYLMNDIKIKMDLMVCLFFASFFVLEFHTWRLALLGAF